MGRSSDFDRWSLMIIKQGTLMQQKRARWIKIGINLQQGITNNYYDLEYPARTPVR
jgi:hypothetical protein